MRRERKSPGSSGRSCSVAGRSLLAIETRCLAGPFTQIIEFGAAYLAARHNVDLIDAGRVQGEDPLHADAVGDFSASEGRTVAFARESDDDSVENLSPLLFAFHHVHLNPNRLTRSQCGDLFLGLFRFNLT